MTSELRIGTLGAAKITPMALIRPARNVDRVSVTAVAARDRGRADAFAKKHGIAKVYDATRILKMAAAVTLEGGEIRALNPVVPQFFHGLKWRKTGGAGQAPLSGRDPPRGYVLGWLARRFPWLNREGRTGLGPT